MKNSLGHISKQKDGFQVRFERILNHPIKKVWDAITKPEQLKYWFTDIEMDFREGGKMYIQFRDEAKTTSNAEIIRIEEPHRFVWSWEGELAEFELSELDKNSTRLVFTYSKLPGGYAIKAPAGFHSLLDLLEETLAGSKTIHPFGAQENDGEHLKLQALYAASVYKNYPELVDPKPIVVEKVYKASTEKVWKAITDKDQMKQWYFELDDFKPEVGFEFQFPGQGHKGQQYIHLCKVTEVIPFEKLQYSWTYKDYPGFSLVTFELEKEGAGTKVTLTHFGLESFPADNPDFAKESFNGGWNELIGNMLMNFLES